MNTIRELMNLLLEPNHQYTFEEIVKKIGKNRGNIWKEIRKCVADGTIRETEKEITKKVIFFTKIVDNK